MVRMCIFTIIIASEPVKQDTVHLKQDFKDNEGFSDYQGITSFSEFSDDSVDDINAGKSVKGS